MELMHSSTALDCPASQLIVEGWNEAVQSGMTRDCEFPVSARANCVFAVSREGDVVGVVAYTLEASAINCTIDLVYVEHSSRRKGVFRSLMSSLAKHCIGAGTAEIPVPTANGELSAALAKLGFLPVSQVLSVSFEGTQ